MAQPSCSAKRETREERCSTPPVSANTSSRTLDSCSADSIALISPKDSWKAATSMRLRAQRRCRRRGGKRVGVSVEERLSKDIGAILVQGIRAASVVPTFMSQVAASMLAVAAARFSAQGYEAPLRSGFIRHGVLPPSMAVAATHASARIAALAASPSESKTLPTLQLSVAEYGLGVPSIVVYAAAEPKRLQVAGAALAVGAAPSPGEDQAAKSFFEDLLRRGRLKIPRAGKGTAETLRAAAPQTHETHTHELRREGKHMVLRRVRIDCGFAHH
jgi:hypothetical protein